MLEVGHLKELWADLDGEVLGVWPMGTPFTGKVWLSTIQRAEPMLMRAITRHLLRWTMACVFWSAILVTTGTLKRLTM